MNLGTTLPAEADVLIRTFLLEKAIYELGYELNGRPDWTIIPLRGIHYIMKRYQEEKGERNKE
jgi:maltose alpha-D-glucosyltransferase/alpha-amylase